MRSTLSPATLIRDNMTYFGTAGRSAANRERGFRPAFRDGATGKLYFSCFADGRPAAVHVLDGLPDEVVLARSPAGRVKEVKVGVVAGFVRDGCFYTRDEAMRERENTIEALLAV